MAQKGYCVAFCVVCSEEYRETGEHVPRIFPCSHTVCEGCISRKLLRKFSLDCPQCGASHFAPDGLNSFPINRYILAHIHKTADRPETKTPCEAHTREQNLFCVDCETPICLFCLKDGHKGHDFRDDEEGKQSGSDIVSVRKNIQESKDELESLQQKHREAYQTCVQQIKSKTTELVDMIKEKSAQFVEDLKDEASKFDAEISHMLNQMNDDVDKLSQIVKGNQVTLENESHEKTLKRKAAQGDPGESMESSRPPKEEKEDGIDSAGNVNDLPAGGRDLVGTSAQISNAATGFGSSTTKLESTLTEGGNAEAVEREPEVGKRPETASAVDTLKGPPTKKRCVEETKNPGVSTVNFTDVDSFGVAMDKHSVGGTVIQPVKEESNKTIESTMVSTVTPEGYISLDLNNRSVHSMSLHPSNNNIICLEKDHYLKGTQGNRWVFTRYNESNGAVIERNMLQDKKMPCGMVLVIMAGFPCLAVSYRKKKKIDFYDAHHLSVIMWSWTIPSHAPSKMCSIAPSTLMWVNHTKTSNVINWFNCETFPPQCSKLTHITSPSGYDMCWMKHRGKQLLITTHCTEGLRADNTVTGALEWEIHGTVPGVDQRINARGVTVDGHSRILVCDAYNYCVHMFSFDGDVLGIAAWFEKSSLPPVLIHPSHMLNSVVVCQKDTASAQLKVIRIP